MNSITLNRAEEQHLDSDQQVTEQVIRLLIQKGVEEFCLCPGSRNAFFVYALTQTPQIKIYYWPEERSAAFFALGRIKATGRPVAVVTTSGTAAGELLPAAMECYYVNLPLVLITADRPRRFRGSGGPQAAEQEHLFGRYAQSFYDIGKGDELMDLNRWNQTGVLHLNVCLEEPNHQESPSFRIVDQLASLSPAIQYPTPDDLAQFKEFISTVRYPLVVVGALPEDAREATISFLLRLGAPVYAEAHSGIREEERLAPLRIWQLENPWEESSCNHYSIDGILKIGSVPTIRLWRDLEYKEGSVQVCTISETPFPGLSWGSVIFCSIKAFCEHLIDFTQHYPFEEWQRANRQRYQFYLELFEEEPLAEASLVHQLSCKLAKKARLYLGNSLPIREWDLAATFDNRHYQIWASRGLSGIDGQLSTFAGFASPNSENWTLLGDLTALYDLAGPWILSQIPDRLVNIVIINNKGGQIFSRLFSHPAFLQAHQLNFEPLARFWNLAYEKWTQIPSEISTCSTHRLIELLPDPQASQRLIHKMKKL